MDLSRITAVIRPRTPWEGVDLGFAMARNWFMPLWLWWLSSALPLYILFTLFIPEAWVVALLIWWLKPLYEPILLFWMSRAMFGDRPRWREVKSNWWRVVLPQLIANLSWRRLSPNRSFNMPVAVLEGLRGRPRRSRVEVLGRSQHVATWLTFVGVAMEGVLEVSFMVLIFIMIPEELHWVDLSDLFLAPGRVGEALQNFGNLIAMSVIAPFYVAGGFALYITRRSELEGWDIELGFRRIIARKRENKRRGSAVATVLLALCMALPFSQDTLAVTPLEQDQSRQLIAEVLTDDDFGKRETETYWAYIGKEDKEKEENDDDASGFWESLFEWLIKFIEGFMKGTASIGEILLWIGGGIALAAFIWWLSKNRGWLPGLPGRGEKAFEAPVSLFGLDLRPESLPDDIAASAGEMLEQGDVRGALSLLYRGALAIFVHQGRPEIPASATEGECLTRVEATRSELESHYFRRLTMAWLALAYGHFVPPREQVETLCNDWKLVNESGQQE
ncbi:MAG: DUF4129 domain-containing protein [Gammaproteobacteria bacterium]|nr:DUF4129 domain-containing protein [Gammaproteobacteria bacterium]